MYTKTFRHLNISSRQSLQNKYNLVINLCRRHEGFNLLLELLQVLAKYILNVIDHHLGKTDSQYN